MNYLQIKAQIDSQVERTKEWYASHTYRYLYNRHMKSTNVKLGRLPDYAPKTTKYSSARG